MNHRIVITRTGHRDERDALAQLIAAAFLPIPPTRWLLEGSQSEAAFADYMRIWVDHGFDTGTIEVAESQKGEVTGVAIWWPEPGAEPADYAARLAAAVDPRDLHRFESFAAAMHGAAHPQHEHLYLGFAAVHPKHQRTGIGTILLQRRHEQLDASGTSAYLVTASDDARRLYLRSGYRDHGQPINLPGGPPMYPMTRNPADSH